MNPIARARVICQITALPVLLACVFQQYILVQKGKSTGYILEPSSLFYVLVILISSVGYQSAGTFIAGTLSALCVTFFYFRIHLGIPWICHISFLGTCAIVFYFLVKANRQGIRDRIEFNDLEAALNDLSLQHQKSIQSVKSFKSKIHRYSQLRELGAKLASTLSLNEVAQRTLQLLQELVGKGDKISLFLLDHNLKSLTLAHEILLTQKGTSSATNAGDVFNVWIMKNRQNLYIENARADFRFEKMSGPMPIASLISVPLITDNKLMGAIRMVSHEANCFTIDELRILATLASIVSASLKNAHLFAETLELSLKDGLTNLFVSTHFHQELQKTFEHSQKNDQPLSVLIADVDDFKKVNDQFGHTVGDSVLKKISEIIRETIGPVYIPTRYGGEEFCAFFPGWNVRDTRDLAETLRKKISDISFDIRREQLHVTVSIGISEIKKEDQNKDQVLHRADSQLYAAKKEGKNRVCTDL